MLPPEDQKLLEDVRTLKDVPADENGSSTDEEHVEEQQSDEVKPKLVPVARYAVCVFRRKIHITCNLRCFMLVKTNSERKKYAQRCA